MIIKELNLIGFGQFNNKVIELKDGLNIIYGENEAGKTTIHNFINGIFYGFLKPYARRTLYSDEHGKYVPWDKSRYGGILKFTYDGKEYRIEREFTKNHEQTNVFLDDTGEDITNTIDNGDGGRILQPGYHFFGFNDAVFSNTLSIKQLGNKTEDSLANEVRERLVNISTTLDDNLSIERAVAELNKSIKEIGTLRAVTSPYGIAWESLNQIKSKRESILSLKDEYNSLLIKKENYDNELGIQIQNLKGLENRLNDAIILSKMKLYSEANNLNNTIKDFKLKEETYKRYKDLSIEDYSRCINLSNKATNIDEKIKEYENTLIDIQEKKEQLESRVVEENRSLVNIESDYTKYEELDEEKANLRYTDYNNRLQILKRDRDENTGIKNKLTFSIIISIGIILSSFIFRNLSQYLPIIVNIVMIPMILYFVSELRKVKNLLSRIDNQFSDLAQKEQLRITRIESIDNLLKSILTKYQVSSKLELKRRMDKFQYVMFSKEETTNRLNENKIKERDIIQKIKDLKEESQRIEKELDTLLNENASEDLEDFKSGLEKKKIYEDTLAKISSKKDLLVKILGHYQLDELRNEIENHQKDISNIDESMTVDELKNKIAIKKDEINNQKIEISRYEEGIKNFNKEISKLVEMDEEIARLEGQLKESDMKREALELAKSTIEDISKDIHRQFAPMINKKVGSIIEDITGGRYNSVKIDNSLEIGVINPETKEIVDINNLSGGTIDQLYFALRFGIVDSINNMGLPLILDDCFIQYDDNRIRNIVKFLYEKSKERQIILFTCHSRENKILDEMKVEYNLINLNNS